MTCRRVDLGGGAVSWSCGRGPRPTAERCEICRIHPAMALCGFALRGIKAGQTCGKRLCERCGGGSGLCPPHAKISPAAR